MSNYDHHEADHYTNPWQKAVSDFHDATGGPGTIDTPEGRLLRAKLIMEEAVETAAALGFCVLGRIYENSTIEGKPLAKFSLEQEFDIIDFIDGLCDLIYVTAGAGVNAGVDLTPHFDEVHRANMEKVSAKRFREDGKVLKPLGWKPPDHEAILRDKSRW